VKRDLRTTTGIVIGVVALGLIGYDIYVLFFGQYSTISEWVWTHSRSYPLIPFSAGLLCGHFFWNAANKLK
jgi:hypothetical protein